MMLQQTTEHPAMTEKLWISTGQESGHSHRCLLPDLEKYLVWLRNWIFNFIYYWFKCKLPPVVCGYHIGQKNSLQGGSQAFWKNQPNIKQASLPNWWLSQVHFRNARRTSLVVKNRLPMQGTKVWFLVGELKSHTPHGTARKVKNRKKEICPQWS